MKTIQVSKFKARCLGLLKEIRETGEPLVVTLRGKSLAVVQPPHQIAGDQRETVAETLERLRPLLAVEAEDIEAPKRGAPRPSASEPLGEDD